ncbi:MAG: sigma 54-interacting transcriptional regulator [Acidobacteria bacterium]|nr:sigma 54-interacting transcriptional regulator [Acidobacteriota bacterium]
MNLGRFPRALEKHRRAVQISEKSRSVIPRIQALGNLAECLCRMGRTQESLNVLESVMKTVGESDNPAVHHAFNTILAEVKIAENDYCGAYQIIRQIGAKISNSRAVYAVGHARYITAILHYILGNFDEAVGSIEMLYRMETIEAPFYERELADALYARILFEQGLTQKAVKRLRSLDKIVAKKHWPYQMAIIKLHLSEILIRQGNLNDAGVHAGNALRLAGAMQSAPLISHCHLLSGILHSIVWDKGGRSTQTGLPGRSILREPLNLERAVEELRASCRLIEGSGHREIAWRAHAELCRIFGRLHDDNRQLHHAKAAYDCLCRLESRTPSKLLPSFWNAFNRNRTKSELARLIGSAKDPGAGSDIVVSDPHDEDQARILFRVSTAVNSIRDLEPLLEAILDQLIQATGMERALVFLKEGSLEKWKAAKGRNSKKECVTNAVSISPAILEEVGRRGNPILSANVREDPRLTDKILTIPGSPGRLLCAPLKVSGRVLGLLYADHSTPLNTLNESVINLFAAFCNLSAIAIDNSIAQQQLIKEKKDLERYLHEVREEYAEIVGTSAAVEALRDRIAIVAASPLDVLITGESGTGKELVARAIHRTCRRSSCKFLPVDCGSLSDSLAEAELFGYRKGAFTGALEDRPGLLEAAHGGIIFLDEISNLRFRLQAKLLRVLEEREVRRVGETSLRKIDVQVIAATNLDLLNEIEEGRFRKDLYYRLKKMEVRVPPLRERLEDIPLLAQSFLQKTAENEDGRLKSFSSKAMALLKRYPYPGNVRELLNVVAGSYYSSDGHTINAKDLPPEVRRDDFETESTESAMAARLYREILDGKGNFEDRIKDPFLRHDFGSSVVRGVLQRALQDSGGRYREAFTRLGIPDRQYASTLQFLKRHRCYLDFRLYRRRQSGDQGA